jgi:hypothetical protein
MPVSKKEITIWKKPQLDEKPTASKEEKSKEQETVVA